MAIKPEVLDGHLARNPGEHELLKPFLHGFDINYGREYRSANAFLSIYLASPHPHIREAFGIDQELLLAYSKFDNLQPRTLQAMQEFLNDGEVPRADRRVQLLVSAAPDPVGWVKTYQADNREQRLIVAFAASELRAKAGDPWYVRNELAAQLYSCDLFGDLLPLTDDAGFFGRGMDVQALRQLVQRGGIGGLFGLRRTGKTSLLYKLKRDLEAEGLATAHRINCERAEVWKGRATDLLDELTHLLSGAPTTSPDLVVAARQFEAAASRATADGQRVVFMFDEIEKISPLALQVKHWRTDFIELWQVIRAVLDENRRLAFVLTGVNPAVTEAREYTGVGNPLFGIVSVRYLSGLSIDDLRLMLRTLGRPTGIRFEEEAVRAIHTRYGGNTYLTRLACKQLADESVGQRPLTVTPAVIAQGQALREGLLAPYCQQVVGDLKDYYPDEYALLELLATRREVEFREQSRGGAAITHLRHYGLLADTPAGPAIPVAVIGRYLAEQVGDRWLPTSVERPTWLRRRVQALAVDIRSLERKIDGARRFALFGVPSFPEDRDFHRMPVAEDIGTFREFIHTMNRCFVESIELCCKRLKQRKDFWAVKDEYSDLFTALDRVKVYRHYEAHLALNDPVEERFDAYRVIDLDGRRPSSIPDLYFVLQFQVIERLLIAVWNESERLS